jgi:hypothetical protein
MKRATTLNATWIALLASLTMAGGQTAAPAPTPSPTMDITNSAKVTDTRGSDGVSPAIVRANAMSRA